MIFPQKKLDFNLFFHVFMRRVVCVILIRRVGIHHLAGVLSCVGDSKGKDIRSDRDIKSNDDRRYIV